MAGFQHKGALKFVSGEAGGQELKVDRQISHRSWQTSRGGYASYNSEWNAIKIKGLPADAKALDKIVCSAGVRIIKTMNECRFDKAASQAPVTKTTEDGTDMTLSSFDPKGAKIEVKAKNAGLGSYKFFVEKDGKRVGQFHAYRTRSESDHMVFEIGPQGRQTQNWRDDEVDLVVTYPGETIQNKLELTFTDVPLPR